MKVVPEGLPSYAEVVGGLLPLVEISELTDVRWALIIDSVNDVDRAELKAVVVNEEETTGVTCVMLKSWEAKLTVDPSSFALSILR